MRVAAILSLLLLAACDGPSAPEPRGPGRGVGGPTDLPSPVAAPAPPASRSRRERRAPAPSSIRGAAPAVAAPDSVPAPRAPDASELSIALQRAFGTPTECISAATRERLSTGDPERRLTMQVEVVVTGSGRVTRASVSGSQLSEDDLECLRRRAEGLRFSAPIPDAPRSIRASIEYTVRSARVTPSGPDPIVGVPSSGPGQVAPSSTLPGAQTETERPPGFIPPSSTLPALAE